MLKLYKPDPVWCDHPDFSGVRFRIQPIMPGDVQARVLATMRAVRDPSTGDVTQETDLRMIGEREFAARHIAPFVLGWEGIGTASGDPAPFSVDNLLSLLRQRPGLTTWILKTGEELGERLLREEEEGKAPSSTG